MPSVTNSTYTITGFINSLPIVSAFAFETTEQGSTYTLTLTSTVTLGGSQIPPVTTPYALSKTNSSIKVTGSAAGTMNGTLTLLWDEDEPTRLIVFDGTLNGGGPSVAVDNAVLGAA